MIRKLSLFLAAGAMLSAIGCNADDSTAVLAGRNETTPTTMTVEECPWDRVDGSRGQRGINMLVSDSDVAVVGEVTAVSAPRWNSKTGERWCPPLFGTTRPILYRDVTIKVTQPIFSSSKLMAKKGDEVTVRTFGDGTQTGKEAAEFSDGSILTEGEVDGRFNGGAEVLVLLAQVDNFPVEGGAEVVNQVVGSWLGSWQVDRGKDRAISVQPERSVPFGKLVARLEKERQMGRNPQRDQASARNPLGE